MIIANLTVMERSEQDQNGSETIGHEPKPDSSLYLEVTLYLLIPFGKLNLGTMGGTVWYVTQYQYLS